MGKYKIKILPVAQDDMKSIVAYIRLDNPDAALKVAHKIKDSIGRLSDNPFMGVVPRDNRIAGMGYRMLLVEPYLVLYIVVQNDGIIEVHRVLHGRRDYTSNL